MARAPLSWIGTLLLVPLVLAGCARDEGGIPIATPAKSPDLAGGVRHQRLDLDDAGSTVHMAVGTTATLTLVDPAVTWGEPQLVGASVSVTEQISDAETPGRIWDIVATASGISTLTVAGSPTCRSATPPCATPDRLVTVTFDVAG